MEELIALLFLARNSTHKEHLRTKSYAAHMALCSFYKDVIDLADSLAEAYQGDEGLLEDITCLPDSNEAVIPLLEKQLRMIEILRVKASKRTAIQNIIDEIVSLYLSTLYKLKNLS